MKKTCVVEASVTEQAKDRIKEVSDKLGISEAEFVRGAVLARLRREDRNRVVFTLNAGANENRN